MAIKKKKLIFLEEYTKEQIQARSVLAVDPGALAGWCHLYDGVITSHGLAHGDNPHAVYNLIHDLKPDLLVVEDQFIQFRNESIKTLIGLRYLWEWMSKLHGAKVAAVAPVTWQSWAKVRPGNKPAIDRLASSIAGRVCQPNESDAVLIASWWAANCSTVLYISKS